MEKFQAISPKKLWRKETANAASFRFILAAQISNESLKDYFSYQT